MLTCRAVAFAATMGSSRGGWSGTNGPASMPGGKFRAMNLASVSTNSNKPWPRGQRTLFDLAMAKNLRRKALNASRVPLINAELMCRSFISLMQIDSNESKECVSSKKISVEC